MWILSQVVQNGGSNTQKQTERIGRLLTCAVESVQQWRAPWGQCQWPPKRRGRGIMDFLFIVLEAHVAFTSRKMEIIVVLRRAGASKLRQ